MADNPMTDDFARGPRRAQTMPMPNIRNTPQVPARKFQSPDNMVEPHNNAAFYSSRPPPRVRRTRFADQDVIYVDRLNNGAEEIHVFNRESAPRRRRERSRSRERYENYDEDSEYASRPGTRASGVTMRMKILAENGMDDEDDEDTGADGDSPMLELLDIKDVELQSILSSMGSEGDAKESHSSGLQGQTYQKNFGNTPGLSVYNVLQSKYTGESLAGGTKSVKLVASENDLGDGVFRWLHFEPTAMHWDQFKQQVFEIPALTKEEKDAIAKLCKRVPKKLKVVKKDSQTAHSAIEPGYVEQSFSVEKEGGAEKLNRKRTLRFWCLPFLYLGRYAGSQSPNRVGPKPMPTLLQTRYEGVNEARDKLQASCQALGKDLQLCFHVPQLWCLTIDNDMLITCAQIPHKLLRGDDAIKLITQNTLTQTPEIKVTYGANTMWSLPLRQCENWFDLTCNFWEFWLNDFKLYCLGKLVDANSWPKVYAAAIKAGTLELELQPGVKRVFQINDHIYSTVQRLQIRSPEFRPPFAGGSSKSTHRKPIQALLLLAEAERNGHKTRPTDAQTHSQVLNQILIKVHQYLSASTKTSNRLEGLAKYRECIAVEHPKVQDLILARYPSADDSDISDGGKLRTVIHERIMSVFVVVETLVEIFIPLDIVSDCTSKIWGAVLRQLLGNLPSEIDEDFSGYEAHAEYLEDLVNLLIRVAGKAAVLLDMISLAPRTALKNIMPFNSLVQAFVELILFLVNLSPDIDEEDNWETHYRSFYRYINAVTTDLVRGLSRNPLLESTIVSPTDVGLLMSNQVLQDVTSGQPDVRSIYKTYIGQLDDEINTDSSQRIYQQSLLLLRQEVETLKTILSKQYTILDALLVSSGRDRNFRAPRYDTYKEYKTDYRMEHNTRPSIRNVSKTMGYERNIMHVNFDDLKVFGSFDDSASAIDRLSATDPDGLRGVFADEAMQLIQERQSFFEELLEQIDHLDTLNDRKFTASADRRDLAVYAFAIVTIVFLPISTIAAIFSIDADNVPNLGSIQWLFWAVAAPLSVVIIVGGLLWAGELGNTWRGFVSWFSQRQVSVYSAKYGYAPKASITKKDRGSDTLIVPASLAHEFIRIAELRKERTGNENGDAYYEDMEVRKRPTYQRERPPYERERSRYGGLEW